jgi:16S rRNA (cytidine1402-2'-O)-methyltransferase
MPGTLFVVATPIGNLEDITLRALRVLREVSLIAAEDTRRTSHLLARHAIATPTTSLHEHNETRKSGALLARLLAGDSIALVSDAGTPTISDPGGVFIRQAIDAGVRVEPIPGPSAVLATLAVAGLPTETFCFLGFPPTRSKDRKQWFVKLREHVGTVVFFEAPHRILRTLAELKELLGDPEVVIGRELTKAHEELVRGPISRVSERLSGPRGEICVALSIGQKTETTLTASPDTNRLGFEYGEMTNNRQTSRREAISALAKRHGLSSKEIYRRLEDAKKSG